MSADFAILLAEMQADFIDELPERCARLEEWALACERGQADALDELYRQVHSLKGSGGMFGLPVITTICHQFESFISEAYERFDKAAVAQALAYVDLLRRVAAPSGRDAQGIAGIEKSLEQMRSDHLRGRVAVLVVEPSEAMRKMYQEIFVGQPVQLVMLDSGLEALQRMLHEPFGLVLATRELPDLNALALMAAVRESGGRNSDIPAILVSSNPAPVPTYLRILATLKRDPRLAAALRGHVAQLLSPSKPK
jgi:CheY-like chemotaxis protein/HPt (histidine-containing phosphotransfer) domain-containing protein